MLTKDTSRNYPGSAFAPPYADFLNFEEATEIRPDSATIPFPNTHSFNFQLFKSPPRSLTPTSFHELSTK